MLHQTIPPKTLEAPNGRDPKFVTFSPEQLTTFQVRVPAHLRVEGDDGFVNVDAPAQASYLYSAPRQCGDWYAMFEVGKGARCATGPTQADAIGNAAAMFAEVSA